MYRVDTCSSNDKMSKQSAGSRESKASAFADSTAAKLCRLQARLVAQ